MFGNSVAAVAPEPIQAFEGRRCLDIQRPHEVARECEQEPFVQWIRGPPQRLGIDAPEAVQQNWYLRTPPEWGPSHTGHLQFSDQDTILASE